MERLTLDEAIKHAKEVAKTNLAEATYNFPDLKEYYDNCSECANQHNQLAEWLEELQKYKQLGTLEEVREAMEWQHECKDCGYKNHSDRISELNSCNDCGLVNICEKRPEYGQYCRINCYDWRCRNER